ncbi:MAG: diaminopimelate epimerase [Phycisphaerae bacterium]
MQPIEFAKLSGSGNDFVCIDNRDGRYDEVVSDPSRVGHFARSICKRGLSVGADGVIFALSPETPEHADVAARFFEADGTEAELCGNGTACFVHWMIGHRCNRGPELYILTPAGIVRGRNSDNKYVRVCIPLPEEIHTDVQLTVAGAPLTCDYAITGVPHVVKYVQDIDKVDIDRLGRRIRHHERFAPRGANANFVEVLAEGRIAIRTFEFGVEAETLACGTGSASAAILTAMRNQWPAEYFHAEKPVEVLARSGDTLRIYFEMNDEGKIVDLCLETVVRYVYSGVLHPELADLSLNGVTAS